MENILDATFRFEPGMTWQAIVLSVLASFVCCQAIAAVYAWTFNGLSYARSFVVSLAMTGVVATILMLAIGDNVARGLGLLGALAVVRFRTNLRDVKDLMFVFASLSVGTAAGAQSFLVAGIGTIAFCLFAVHFALAPFGSRRKFDGLLRLNTPADPSAGELLKDVLRRHCSTYVLVNLREISQGSRLEHAYQVKLRDPSYQPHLLAAIGSVGGIQGVSLLMQDPTIEV